MINWMQKISREIFEAKYMLHGEKDPDEVFRKIADEIASAEETDKRKEWAEKFYNEISSGRLIPAAGCLQMQGLKAL